MAAAFLANFLFWTGLSIGAIAFAALVEVCGGGWAGSLRVTSERLGRFLPVSLIAFVVLMWRSRDVFPWAQQPAADLWFRPWVVAARDGLALVAVYVAAFAFCRASARARRDEAEPAPLRSAVTFLIVYAIGFGVVVVDLIMSLEPRWTSTLFPGYVLTTNVYSGVAIVALLSAWGPTRSSAGLAHAQTRDIANILAGLALFWTYLFWSQFLVIWYGNLTAELAYMTARIGVSRVAGWMVLAMCGAAPALVFVPQWGKQITAVRVMAIVILAGLWLERWILVAPDLPQARGVVSVAMTAAYFAVFMLSIRPTSTSERRDARPHAVRAPDS
jgi:hypothetical protein